MPSSFDRASLSSKCCLADKSNTACPNGETFRLAGTFETCRGETRTWKSHPKVMCPDLSSFDRASLSFKCCLADKDSTACPDGETFRLAGTFEMCPGLSSKCCLADKANTVCPDGETFRLAGTFEICPGLGNQHKCCLTSGNHDSSTDNFWLLPLCLIAGAIVVALSVGYGIYRYKRSMRHQRECNGATHLTATVSYIAVPTNTTSVEPPPRYAPTPLPVNVKSFVDAGTGKTYYQRPDGSTTWSSREHYGSTADTTLNENEMA